MNPLQASKAATDEHGYFEAYARFAGTLRAWLVAYGIGGPALLITQDKLAERFMGSNSARYVIVLFLFGVVSQLCAAVLYKTAMWYLYIGERSEKIRRRRMYRASNWISEAYWLEAIFDLASIILFGIATFRLLTILTTT